jgi:hypothetical protein
MISKRAMQLPAYQADHESWNSEVLGRDTSVTLSELCRKTTTIKSFGDGSSSGRQRK